ncbi:MAG: hypothetical protein GY856_01490 [bacterium]|nr:hypothetical protein [bacterium]
MDQPVPKQLIQVGDSQIALPEGVSVADWGLEKVATQNPRIRAFLGCIDLLGGVLESNYAILHCSPERLIEIWRRVRQVSEHIRRRIAPLLRISSQIPKLEEARQSSVMALELLEVNVLVDLDRFPSDVGPHRLMELRKLLCVSIGQLHSFLQDTFSQLAASDPRSGTHDADYFLSRRFAEDIEEAEWLQDTVVRLQEYLEQLDGILPRNLAGQAEQMRVEKTIPHDQTWENLKSFLDQLLNTLTPKMKGVLALRGIRFYEMEILDRYTIEIPTKSRMLVEIHDLGCKAIDRIQGQVGKSHDQLEQCGRDLETCHAVCSERMATLMTDIDKYLRDLIAFVPLWLEGIERRRALILMRTTDGAVEVPGSEEAAAEGSAGGQTN